MKSKTQTLQKKKLLTTFSVVMIMSSLSLAPLKLNADDKKDEVSEKWRYIMKT